MVPTKVQGFYRMTTVFQTLRDWFSYPQNIMVATVLHAYACISLTVEPQVKEILAQTKEAVSCGFRSSAGQANFK